MKNPARTIPGIFLPRNSGLARALAILVLTWLTSVPVSRGQPTATLTTLYAIASSDSNTGGIPNSLIQGSDGNFYGTTTGDDTNGYTFGTVFMLTPAGALTTLYNFPGGDGGGFPVGGLVQGSDGSFYGTTAGGYSPIGETGFLTSVATIFKITPDGAFTLLHTFHGGSNEAQPMSSLTQGSDGNFYGTGGAGANGSLFMITPAGDFSTFYSFTDGTDGRVPIGSLVQGSDGNFYGTTSGVEGNVGSPGVYDGTVYKITPAGVHTTLYTFTGGTEPGFPSTGLTLGSDGNFYGATSVGSANPYGTIFKITPDGTFTTLYSLKGGNDGGNPDTTLVQGSDGNFYGTTPGSPLGATEYGTLFRVTPAGAFTTLYTFTYGSDGTYPSSLIQGSDGNFYGTTGEPDALTGGTIFQLTVHPAFFEGETALGNGIYYLMFPNGDYFGYYSFLTDPDYIYHFDLGYEYVFDANDSQGGVYFYDFASSDYFYTSPTFPFPYLYDFGLNSVVYYYPDPNNPGHYNTDGMRDFYVFSTGQIITK